MTTAIGTCLMFTERRITSEAAYRAFHAERVRKSGVRPDPQSEPLLVGLDSGVWLAWCHKGVGVGVHPDWNFAACSCGRTWDTFTYPATELLERIDAVLALRPAGSISQNPARFYSWRPNQSIAELVRENLARGWAIPDGARTWR